MILAMLKSNSKISKTIKLITYQPKTFENPKIADIKLIVTEQPKTSHKLPKTVRQAKKVCSNSPLYSDTQKN